MYTYLQARSRTYTFTSNTCHVSLPLYCFVLHLTKMLQYYFANIHEFDWKSCVFVEPVLINHIWTIYFTGYVRDLKQVNWAVEVCKFLQKNARDFLKPSPTVQLQKLTRIYENMRFVIKIWLERIFNPCFCTDQKADQSFPQNYVIIKEFGTKYGQNSPKVW